MAVPRDALAIIDNSSYIYKMYYCKIKVNQIEMYFRERLMQNQSKCYLGLCFQFIDGEGKVEVKLKQVRLLFSSF
jgi:hypothetical protein